MNDFDRLSSNLFEEAKRFLEKATNASGDLAARGAYAHAALLLGFSSLEAHVNAVAEELAERPHLGVLDISILTERDYALDSGLFQATQKLKMYRLEDRLLYIFANFSVLGSPAPTSALWWPKLKAGTDLRNQLVHPKANVAVEPAQVECALLAILECLNSLYLAVFSRPFPPHKRGLQSVLSF